MLLRVYQLTLSRLLVALFGPVCRFTPSCSAYAIECIRLHGAARGSLLSMKRLSKCHPFHPGGYDPPPPPRERASRPSETGGLPVASPARPPSTSSSRSTARQAVSDDITPTP
jgi:uncharacterized protein